MIPTEEKLEKKKRERGQTPDIEDLAKFKVQEKMFPVENKEVEEMKRRRLLSGRLELRIRACRWCYDLPRQNKFMMTYPGMSTFTIFKV